MMRSLRGAPGAPASGRATALRSEPGVPSEETLARWPRRLVLWLALASALVLVLLATAGRTAEPARGAEREAPPASAQRAVRSA